MTKITIAQGIHEPDRAALGDELDRRRHPERKAMSRPDPPAIASSRVTAELLSRAQSYLKDRDDTELVLKAAWREFYELCSLKIRNFAVRCGMADHDVADCVQEVWAELIVRLPIFQLNPACGQFETWLFRIVQCKTANLHVGFGQEVRNYFGPVGTT